MIRRTVFVLLLASINACASSGRGGSPDGCRNLDAPPLSAVVTDPAALESRLSGLLDEAGGGASFTIRYRPMEDDVVLARDSAGRSEALLDSLEAAVRATLIERGADDDINSHRLVFRHGRLETRGVEACAPNMLNQDEIATALRRAQSRVMGEGTAVIWILIDEQGTPQEVTIQQGSGSEALDAAAMGVGYVARFSPASIDAIPVRVYIQLPIQFATRG